MYFNASILVTIGDKVVETVSAVRVKNDSKEIGSSCKIVMPLMTRISYVGKRNQYLTDLVKNLFKVQDPVTVVAKYEGYPDIKVFSGFVYDFLEGTPMTVECMDNIFLLNQTTVNLEYQSVTLRDVLKRILQGTGVSLIEPTLDLSLTNITFRLMSPASVLEYFKKELGLHISLSDNKLYVNIASNTIATVFFDTAVNVIHSGLQKPEAVYLKLKVKAWFIQQNGKKSSIEVGDTNGELREVFFYKIPFDPKKYQQLAGEALIKYKMMKFSGNIETLLYPDCGLFWRARYIDHRYPDRNGYYTIVGMNFEIGEHGYHRHIKMAYLMDLDSAVNSLAEQNNIVQTF